MVFEICPLEEKDRSAVIDIFNYYIENSFAAFPESRVGYEYFDLILNITAGYPRITVQSKAGETVGFAFLRPHSPMPAFKRTAEISYFIKPEETRKGMGGSMLEHLVAEAKMMGIDTLLASISSHNQKSIDFHDRNGFELCGTLKRIGRKFNEDFDVVLIQRQI